MSPLDTISEQTWQANRDALFRFVLPRVSDPAAAEDIVQDVLLKAHRKRDSLQSVAKLRPWLYQITRHAIVDYYRSRRPSDPLPEDIAEDDARDAESGILAQRELSRCLRPLLAQLPPHYAQALQLTEFDGLTQQAAARRLGISVSGLKSRVQRGRRLLRDSLLDACQIAHDARGRVLDYDASSPHANCPACAEIPCDRD